MLEQKVHIFRDLHGLTKLYEVLRERGFRDEVLRFDLKKRLAERCPRAERLRLHQKK